MDEQQSITRGISASENRHSRYRFAVLGTFGLSNIVGFLTVISIGILLPSISDELGLSPKEQGWLGSSALVGNLIFALPMTLAVSRLNLKLVTALTIFLGAGFVLMQGWAPIFAVLLLGRLLFGLSMLAREPLRPMLIAQWFPPREYFMVNGFINSTFGIGMVLGLLLTPLVLLAFDNSWRATLITYAVAYFVIGVAWVFLGKERKTQEYETWLGTEIRSALKGALRHKEVWLVAVGLFGVDIGFGAMITFWPTHVLQEHQVPLTVSGSIQALSGLLESIAGIATALYMMKRDIRRPLITVCSLLLVFTSIGMVLSGSISLLVVLSALHGMGGAFFPVLLTIPFELRDIRPREIAVATVFIEMSSWAGIVMGPTLAGFLQEATDSLSVALVTASLFGFLMLIAGLTLPSPRRTAAPDISHNRDL